MSHPLVNAGLSGNHQPPQKQNRPPAKDILKGFSSLGPPSWLTSPGSSSATLSSYMPGQKNRAVSGNNTLIDCVKCVEPSEFPSSSATSSTSQLSAEIDGTSLDWLPKFKQAPQNDAPEFPYLTCAAGLINSRRVSSGEQIDNKPWLDDYKNPVPGRSVLSPESNQTKHPKEPVATILQRYDLDEDNCSLNQVNPERRSCILHQTCIGKDKRAAGKSSKPHSKLRSILKPSKAYEKTSSDSTGWSADGLPLDKESKRALDSNRTSLAKPASGPSERLLEATTRPKVSPQLTSSNSKPGKAQRNQTVVEKQKPKKPIRQKTQKQKTDLQTQPKLGKSQQNKPIKKTQKGWKQQGWSSKPPFSRRPEVQQPDFEAGHSLTLGMIEDYKGVPPRYFPHQCSLCFRSIEDLTSWISHQRNENHNNSRRLFRIKYPGWIDGQPPPRNTVKKKAAAAKSLEPPQLKRTKPESRPRSNGADRCQAGRSSGGSRPNPIRRTRSRSHSSGSRRGSKWKRCSSRSRSRSGSVSRVEGERRSSSPRSSRQTDPSHRENPDVEASVCPQSKYTPESAAEVLQMFGLDKEDLKELDSYPEDQVTLENLHLVLRQIFLRKKKRAAAAENGAEGPETSWVKTPQGPLKPVKVIDYGHSSVYTVVGDATKMTGPDNSEAREEKPKQKDTRPLKPLVYKLVPQSGQTSTSKIRKSTPTGGRPSGSNSSKKTKLKKIKAESKVGKASPCDVSSAKLTPIKPATVRASNHLPTFAMIKDYAAATPRTFPHTCSICNKKCLYMQDWLLHQNTSFHLESCRILRTQFPQWDGDVLPIISAEIRSSRPASLPSSNGRWSKSRSRSRSNSYHRSGSEDRRERSVSWSRSPYGRRYSQRSRSRSPWRDGSSSPLCRSHSRSHEGWSSSERKDELLFSPRRSFEQQTSQKLSHQRRLSKESSGPRSKKASSAGRNPPETSAEVSRGKNKGHRTSLVYHVLDDGESTPTFKR